MQGPYDPSLEETFSIIGRDPATGQLGVAVQSRSLAVGSRVRGGKGGIGPGDSGAPAFFAGTSTIAAIGSHVTGGFGTAIIFTRASFAFEGGAC